MAQNGGFDQPRTVLGQTRFPLTFLRIITKNDLFSTSKSPCCSNFFSRMSIDSCNVDGPRPSQISYVHHQLEELKLVFKEQAL